MKGLYQNYCPQSLQWFDINKWVKDKSGRVVYIEDENRPRVERLLILDTSNRVVFAPSFG